MTGEPYDVADIAPEPPPFVELYHPELDRTALYNRDALDIARASGWVTLDERDAAAAQDITPSKGNTKPAEGVTEEQ